MLLEGLVDERNRELWEDLNSAYNIELIYTKREDYMIHSQGMNATIFIKEDDICGASFTHELLHLWIRKHNCFIGIHLDKSLRYDSDIGHFFHDYFLQFLGNAVDHMKMLPVFLAMGYPTKKFIRDYALDKLPEHEFLIIQRGLPRKTWFSTYYTKYCFLNFIGKYFALMSCPNDSFDYPTRLAQLESLNPQLYEILERFSKGWVELELGSTDPMRISDHELVYQFVMELRNWIAGKKFK